MLKSWVDEWDKRIADWIEQGSECDIGLTHIKCAYQGKKQAETALESYAMPEPYVGDPVSDDPLDAVLLTLNPGGSGTEQWRCGEIGENCELIKEDGALVKEVRSKGYHEVAKKFLLKKTRKWWKGRSQWPARLLGMSSCRIVGIDLIPWHSKKWGSVDIPKALSWFKENVLVPAAIMSKDSTLSKSSNKGYPILLAVGSQHAHYLPDLGFEIEDEKSEKSGLSTWPVQSDGMRVKRNIRLFVAKDKSLAVLQTDARGGFKPPSKAFDPIVRTMLGLPITENVIKEPNALV